MVQQEYNKHILAAKCISGFATDLRKPMGAILVKNGEVIGMGSNQATLRWRWFIEWHKNHCLRKIFKTPKNRWYWFCPGCATNENHAEMCALRSVRVPIKPGEKLDLFLYGSSYCCATCLSHLNKLNIEVHTYEHI